MSKKDRLLKRLEQIGQSLEKTNEALLLLALGSSGVEIERMDEFSDIDFFVIVKDGYKERFIKQLDWLEEAHSLAYQFQNTKDGHKIMFQDGVYGEFAIFEEKEMAQIAYTPGRIIWCHPHFDGETIRIPNVAYPIVRKEDVDFAVNEALTNIYVGLCRYARGEKLSGARFVQVHAVDQIMSVLHLLEEEQPCEIDPFTNERRLEKRFPIFATYLSEMNQGYNHTPQSALCILRYIEERYDVNQTLSLEIRRLVK